MCCTCNPSGGGYYAGQGGAAREAKNLGTLRPREDRISGDVLNGKIEKARVIRKEKRLEAASKALRRYLEDPYYIALHDQIAQVFADLLSQRFTHYLEEVKAGNKKIAAGALLPHEIIEQANSKNEESVVAVAEL